MDVLQPPGRPSGLPSHAKWLAGEGAGSWFVIESAGTNFSIKRFSDGGHLECEGQFSSDASFDLNQQFDVIYPSHCAKVTVIQSNQTFTFITA